MQSFHLNADVFSLELYCPFCGHHVVDSECDGAVTECDHTVIAGPDCGEEGGIRESDIVFVATSGPPACEDYLFVFREPTQQ